MKLRTVNKRLACTPFPDQSVKKSLTGEGAVKVGRIESRVSLVRLKVIAPNEQGIPVGAEVLVRANQYSNTGWPKEVHLDGEQEYILVPADQIEGVYE